jgi:hypothetical protein
MEQNRMSKTILANVDGFTPIIDSLVEDVGIVAAAVFGRMWRYCQMENGVCHASLGTIADELHLSVRTVIRHSDNLVSKGYLKDMTPNLRNVPHTYADTGKAGLEINITGMTKSHSGYDKKSQRAMTKSHLKIVSKKEEEIIDTSSSVEVVKTRDIQAAYESCVTYPVDWKAGEGHAAKWLAEHSYTPDDVRACYAEMKRDQFWSDKPLSLSSVKNRIGQWKSTKQAKQTIKLTGVVNA